MQKIKKLISVIVILMLIIIFMPKESIADVGSFESYDSGSDWGGRVIVAGMMTMIGIVLVVGMMMMIGIAQVQEVVQQVVV